MSVLWNIIYLLINKYFYFSTNLNEKRIFLIGKLGSGKNNGFKNINEYYNKNEIELIQFDLYNLLLIFGNSNKWIRINKLFV